VGIKVFEFLRRKAGTTPEEFNAHWRDVHGPLLANDPQMRRHVRRYELNHRLPEDSARDRQEGEVQDVGWDGVAVLCFDSLDDMRALSAEPGMVAVRDSAESFREDERLIVVTEDPDVIVATPRRDEAEAKMLCILRRNAALDLDTFHEHWLKHHGGLFQTIPELNAPLLGYEQNHGLRDPDAKFDGVTEQWFESLGTFVESLSASAFADIVNPDVAYMLDAASINFVMAGKPTVVIG
jgi:EthD domain-containing protein